ncbi:hypothetical protein CDV31_005336 [Fusarium ambrosium]|uniref:Heterokaryon incompatibility domain-containing protein n=1 Tax=Fusarium ambrosium TaxID=131363 RepID=A0A428UKE7_9HYPO|nr:hypothetical protein CDV31_005336 [Fusarium ambrosium]
MNAQAPPQELTPSPQQHSDFLCDRCRSIDFDTILSQQHRRIVEVVTLERVSPSDCALCRLFAQYCGGGDWGGGILYSMPWNRMFQNCRFTPDPNRQTLDRILTVRPNGFMGTYGMLGHIRGYISEPINAPSSWRDGPAAPRSVDPEAIDFSMIRSWFDFCQDEHSGCPGCKPSKVDPEWQIRFIDCETRLVVEAASLGNPCPPFLALSYVWGQLVDPHYRPPAHDEPLKDLPTTVRDSIVVTQKLGFRYLWVDKYCIRQDDEQDKSRQIRLMAKIYGSAQLTIVAVAGSDPSYGLPGVSRSRRPCQPHDDILSSVWSTRGWTYQEAFLSTRLLVFTDKQIYFQCKDSSFYEAFNIPMWEDSEKPRIFRGVESLEIGVRIHEYTRRNLGNEADILNAFQGVFDLFHENYNHFNNIWGIPITEKSFQHMPAKLLDRFLAGICWKLEMPGNRRHGFPSWSWVGWKGVVNKRCDLGAEPATISNGIGILASFASPDGTRTEWSQLEPTLGADGSQDHLRILVLDCFSFPLQLEEVHGEGDADGPTSDAKTRFRVTGDVVGHFVPLFKRLSWGPDQSRQGRILGVPLDIRSFWEREEGPELFILVFYKKFEFWERVGHFEWSNPEGKINLRAFSNTVRTTRTVLRIA